MFRYVEDNGGLWYGKRREDESIRCRIGTD